MSKIKEMMSFSIEIHVYSNYKFHIKTRSYNVANVVGLVVTSRARSRRCGALGKCTEWGLLNKCENKAVYTKASVAYGWAGALMQFR